MYTYMCPCTQELGPNAPDTIFAMWDLVKILYPRGQQHLYFMAWLLPRMASTLGLGHPDTRQCAIWGSHYLFESPDPREHPWLTRTVTNVCKFLPWGLGWGQATMDPVDQDTYNRIAVMQAKAQEIIYLMSICVYIPSAQREEAGCVQSSKRAFTRVRCACVPPVSDF